jgi:hypothetical protein
MSVRKCPSHWPLERRLTERSVRDPETGCVLWTASRTRDGYGNLFQGSRRWLAHRAAWVVKNGPIPKGLCVCHRCDVRACINPDHLFLGTHKENMADRTRKRERRIGGFERRPEPAPEIVCIRTRQQEIVARILEVRPTPQLIPPLRLKARP